jgi:molybdopterin-containing oxidoreductase family membrane subunit
MAWYSGDVFERQLALFRATGWAAFVYWPLFILNVLAPLAFVFKRARRSPVALFVVSILVNVGMWLERFMIITSSMGHDFLPNNWSAYLPRPVEIAITLGSFAMFFFLFLGFTKLLPTVPMTDLKRLVEEGRHEAAHRAGPATPDHEPALGAVADAPEAQVPLVPPVPKGHDLPPVPWTTRPPRQGEPGAVLVYAGADSLVAGLRMACEAGFHRLETYTPIRVEAAEHLLGRGKSPVRMFALAGGLTGMAAGFGLATFAAMRNSLIVGGKWPFAPIPYMIPAFEGTILLGALGNLAGLLVSARLYRVWQLLGPAPVLDPRFTRDRFGLFVACQPEDLPRLRHAVAASRPEDIHVRA